MRKALWSSAALIALLSGAGVTLGGSAVQAADQTVKMVDGSGDPTTTWKFDPSNITVAAGTTVIFKNTGDQPHTATADDGSFDSGYLSNGKEFSTVVTKTVKFKCQPHPWMTGTITVSGGAPSTPTTAGSTPSTTVAAAPGQTTTTTAAAATTTTAKAAGAPTTTTTAAAGATATTQAPSVTPTTASETAGVTSTTAAAAAGAAGEQVSGGEHGAEEAEAKKKDDDEKSSPLGIAFAAVSTVLLVAICGKLLGSKS